MPIQHNQTWDSEGNLLFEEWVEVPEEETDMTILTEAILSLSPEQIEKLKQALGVV